MTTLMRLLGALFAVALVAAACGGGTATETTDDAMTDDEMAAEEHGTDHGDHGAATIDVNADAPTPGVSVELTETETPGLFNLTVTLTNFTITPENVDGDPIDNQGHMHLLIDGEKLGRFMETDYQVTVPEGEHLVEVEINANNHSAYSIDGVPIRAGQTVTGHGDAMVMGDGEEVAAADDHGDDHSHGEAGSGIEDGLTSADATVSTAATFSNGSVELDGADRIEVAVDDVVMVMITSDVAEQAHLHGYDILVDVEPGSAAAMLFTADTAGKFEIEFEMSGTFIAELVVS